ncbi:MAG: DUF5610 domain-containing protein [Kangiellaceae bacterium]|nr:DUF5610 domain-containing protein [Kangiellaceae bacterium]
MFSPLNSLHSPLIEPSNFKSASHNHNPERQAEITDRLSSGLSRQKSDSFAIFEALLKRSYQRIAFNSGTFGPSQTEVYESQSAQTATPSHSKSLQEDYRQTDKISSDQAANTILKFIGNRIRAETANGANQEELLQRLDQGLQGFIQGHNEAKGIIEDLGLLTASLSTEIEETFTKVTAGIDKLKERIIEPTSLEPPVTRLQQLTLATQISESASFSLSLTTQDGDKVDIQVTRSFESNISANFSTSSGRSELSYSQQTTLANSFDLTVSGELDSDEFAAINQLLEDINIIAIDFYAGRLDQAFELAAELEINREELSSLNLQLQQTARISAIASYQNTAQSPTSDLKSTIEAPLSPFIKLDRLLNNIEGIVQKAGQFSEGLSLIKQLSEGVSSGLVNTESNETEDSQEKSISLSEQLTTLISLFDL